MLKTELANCPQWLLDADTEDEDVYFNQFGILIWSSGDFLDGNFRGGDFRGEKISRCVAVAIERRVRPLL